MSHTFVIEVRDLVKQFKNQTALNHLDLQLADFQDLQVQVKTTTIKNPNQQLLASPGETKLLGIATML